MLNSLYNYRNLTHDYRLKTPSFSAAEDTEGRPDSDHFPLFPNKNLSLITSCTFTPLILLSSQEITSR